MRDFQGYINNYPQVRWPEGARVAVSFVLNVEEGAEFCISEGDPYNEAVYEVIDQQDVADPCIESHFEYGTRVAYWRIMELAHQYNVPMTISACGRAVERSPWLIQDAARRGHEIAAHGWRWETHAGMAVEDEREAIRLTVESIRNAIGKPPVGWHTRSVCTANTRSLLIDNGFLYDNDAYNDDAPYYVDVQGASHLVLPYAFDTNDMQFQHTQRFDTAGSFATYVCDGYDWLYREGQFAPRMLSIGLHLRMIGRPSRMSALERIFKHLQQSQGAWIATREQIARHWLEHVPSQFPSRGAVTA